MLKENQNQYYFFALSNLLAALGGGTILGRGIDAINSAYLKGGSILAFFVGTIFGLVFLQSIPKKWSEIIARWFSFFAAFTSLALLYIFINYSINKQLVDTAAIVFFGLLSLRFGFWFYSRVLRASAAAGKQQSIAWVELGYYLGVIAGLIIWKLIGFEVGMFAALIIDAALQMTAGFLDFFAYHNSQIVTKEIPSQSSEKASQVKSRKTIWEWRLAWSVVFLTVGIQVIIFNLAHQVDTSLSTYVLAFFYLGVSLAAVFYKKLQMELNWNIAHSSSRGYAAIFSIRQNQKISFMILSVLSVCCMLTAIIGISHWGWGTHSSYKNEIFLIVSIFLAAFFYEMLTLALLDRIGLEEKQSNHSGMIIRTYGLMGLSAAISLWLLGLSGNALHILLGTLVVCLLIATLLVRKRKFPCLT